MVVTGKQIRQLRSLAHHLDPIIFIGRQGVTSAIVTQTDQLLEGKELIKCCVQVTSDLGTWEAATALSETVGAEVVQVIGHRFVLYRESKRDDVTHVLVD